MTTDAAQAEILELLAPIKAANPGITNGEIVEHLPVDLHSQFWAQALGAYARAELAKASRRVP
jgi:hypothetical protein